MKNKKECEIVQDLLINYADGILNPESKKLVEEHLSQCEECQEKLKRIKEDIRENDNKEKIEVDYLKKVRIKTRIKSVVIAIGIILLIIIIMFLNNFIKINSITNRCEESLQSNNFYKERTQILSGNQTSVMKEYYKDGKYKSVWEIYSDNGIEQSRIEYGNLNSGERIIIYEKDKKAVIEKGYISEIENSANSIKRVPFVIDRNTLKLKIGTTFNYSIDTNVYANGKECYVLKNRNKKGNDWEIWIDKETGLPVKEISRNAEKLFFAGTEVVKEVRDRIEEYSYEFDKVTDEDVEVPDLSDYTIEYKISNIEE